jgi:CheY-like chemotaxis protein
MRLDHHELSNPRDPENQAAAPESTLRRPSEKPSVLVVDDDHLVRHMVQMGLERNGFDVRLARNGREGIDLYRAHGQEIAVVLLDVRMPGLDGPQTLDVLRELDPDVLACFMSGDTGAYEPKELVERGAACVIAKPFFLDDLVNILRSLVYGDVAASLLRAAT